MRDYLISRADVVEELTRRIGLSDRALQQAMGLVPDYAKHGRYGDVAEVSTDVIGFAYARSAYKTMLSMVKSMPVRGELEGGGNNAQH